MKICVVTLNELKVEDQVWNWTGLRDNEGDICVMLLFFFLLKNNSSVCLWGEGLVVDEYFENFI